MKTPQFPNSSSMEFQTSIPILQAPLIASSSASSFDSSICQSKNANAACWLVGILRRILCSQRLPTYPSDHIRVTSSALDDNTNPKELVEKEIERIDNSPGIVARLMGLDSLPSTNQVGVQINSDSIARNGIVNSLDFGSVSDHMEGHRKRVSSSLSFREIPGSVELENEYIVLSFEKRVDKKKKARKSKQNTKDKGRVGKESEVLAKATSELVVSCKKQDDDFQERRSVDGESHESGAEMEHLQKKINVHDVDIEDPGSSSENSSPVSVLNFGQFEIDSEVPTSEDTTLRDPSSRWRLPLKHKGFNYYQNSNSSAQTSSSKRPHHSQNHFGPWDEICRLAGAEVVGKKWVYRTCMDHQDFEDISADLGVQILYELVEEALYTFA